jgi:predicted nucleic acid-binding protein
VKNGRFTIVRLYAKRHGITVYDGAYLELALRLALQLATRDGAMKRAIAKSGVSAVMP